MENFGLDQLSRVSQRRQDVFIANLVLFRNLFLAHSSRESPDDPGDWDARSANNRPAVLDLRINDDSVIHFQILPYGHDRFVCKDVTIYGHDRFICKDVTIYLRILPRLDTFFNKSRKGLEKFCFALDTPMDCGDNLHDAIWSANTPSRILRTGHAMMKIR